MLEKNNKRLINAWASFDWANSVYNLIVTTAIFPIYFIGATEYAFGGETIQFFGISVNNEVIYTYAISFSFLVIVFLAPVLSGIADFSGRKKRFMQFFTYLGSAACIGLYFFTGENVEYGIICAITASIGFAGSLVFYNAFLPEVATEDQMDRVSARGFSMGYIGSVILLIVNLILSQYPESFGLKDDSAAARFGFILVGLWWMGFAQISFYYLEDKPTGIPIKLGILGHGVRELKKVFAVVKEKTVMYRFLSAFFIYSMGVQTVMLLASIFGKIEVGMENNEMIIVVLILQIVAIAGAYIFALVSKFKGNGFSISATLIIWIFICIAGYFLNDKIAFYGLAGLLGFVMGGVQSISRSTYSKLIPAETKDTASFFSFYDITEKLAIVVGTFTFATLKLISGNMRISLIFMSVFFIGGFVVLQSAKLKKNLEEAKPV